jgi:hypothetical protein
MAMRSTIDATRRTTLASFALWDERSCEVNGFDLPVIRNESNRTL